MRLGLLALVACGDPDPVDPDPTTPPDDTVDTLPTEPAGPPTAGEAALVLESDQTYPTFVGYAVANVGDISGDGLDDLAITAPRWGDDEGRVWWVAPAELAAGRHLLDDVALGSLTGAADGGETLPIGYDVVPYRDVDGDGAPETVVQGLDAAGVFAAIVPGANRADLGIAEIPDVLRSSFRTQQQSYVSGADVTGDGAADLLVSETVVGGGGNVFVVDAPWTGAVALADHASAQIPVLAWDVQLADLDGDGVAEVLASTGEDPYTVSVFAGPLGGGVLPTDADVYTVDDPLAGIAARLGTGDGDLDGDGLNDVVVANSSAVYVFDASEGVGTVQDIAIAEVIGAELARSAFVGDLDGDGAEELAVGVLDGPGSVSVFAGPVAGTLGFEADAAQRWVGEGEEHWLGQVYGGAHLDGDGVPDLVMSAIGWSDSDFGGAVYLFPSE